MARLFVFAPSLVIMHFDMALALKLDSAHLSSGADVPADVPWRIHVDNRTFFTWSRPSKAGLSLSQQVSDYYAAIGSEAALTGEMKARRVGSEGRWHIFHLPEGASTLQVPRDRDRRHAFSSLIQLEDGMRLNNRFPVYTRSKAYVNPLSSEGQGAELAAARFLDADLMQRHYNGITTVGDGTSRTRAYNNVRASKAIQDYLQAEFASTGITTCLQSFGETNPFTLEGLRHTQGFTNIIGYIPGEGPDTLTVGAHYDSRPFWGNAPGANDNGSGVAALLSVLKAMRSTSFRPKKHLFFVAFAAEEIGLYGSDYFARELRTGQGTIPRACTPPNLTAGTHYAIATDEVGWLSPNLREPTVNLESYDWTRQHVLEHLAQASNTINGKSLKVVHSNNPFGSDHMSWLDYRMPAVLVINGDDEAYPAYHQSADTMDNINVEYTVKLARLILGGMMRLAGAPGDEEVKHVAGALSGKTKSSRLKSKAKYNHVLDIDQ